MAKSFTSADKTRFINAAISWVAEGKTLRDFCRVDGNPSYHSIYNWMDEDPEALARFARAREVGFDIIAQEALDIADTPREGIETEDGPNGTKIKRADMLGHRRLQIETRLKLLAKWFPQKYGDKDNDDSGSKVEIILTNAPDA